MKKWIKKEKKRIGAGRWAWMFGGCFFALLYWETLVSNDTSWEPLVMLPFFHWIYLMGGLFTILAVNHKLFFIQEREKSVYLLEKFRMVPIRMKTLFQIRIYILFETMVWYMVMGLAIFFLLTYGNGMEMHWLRLAKEVAFSFLFFLIFTSGLLIVHDYGAERRSRKQK